jgi:hypothetical protein
MKSRITIAVAASIAAVFALPAIAAQQDTKGQPKADNQPAPVVLLVPVEVSDPAMKNGCWAQLYNERNFKGDMFTIVGPMQIDATDKGAAKELHKNLDSLVIGPKATLTAYEHKLFKDKSVQFGPNSKEPGLVKKLGFTGRIESLKLDCAS